MPKAKKHTNDTLQQQPTWYDNKHVKSLQIGVHEAPLYVLLMQEKITFVLMYNAWCVSVCLAVLYLRII